MYIIHTESPQSQFAGTRNPRKSCRACRLCTVYNYMKRVNVPATLCPTQLSNILLLLLSPLRPIQRFEGPDICTSSHLIIHCLFITHCRQTPPSPSTPPPPHVVAVVAVVAALGACINCIVLSIRVMQMYGVCNGRGLRNHAYSAAPATGPWKRFPSVSLRNG